MPHCMWAMVRSSMPQRQELVFVLTQSTRSPALLDIWGPVEFNRSKLSQKPLLSEAVFGLERISEEFIFIMKHFLLTYIKSYRFVGG